jgi:hypothetical protein
VQKASACTIEQCPLQDSSQLVRDTLDHRTPWSLLEHLEEPEGQSFFFRSTASLTAPASQGNNVRAIASNANTKQRGKTVSVFSIKAIYYSKMFLSITPSLCIIRCTQLFTCPHVHNQTPKWKIKEGDYPGG